MLAFDTDPKVTKSNETLTEFHRHVCAEGMKAGVTLGECNPKNWPVLAFGTLTDLLWDLTVYATFGGLDLVDFYWEAWYIVPGFIPDNVDHLTLLRMWNERVNNPVPFVEDGFKKWIIEMGAVLFSFCKASDVDELDLMKKAINTT